MNTYTHSHPLIFTCAPTHTLKVIINTEVIEIGGYKRQFYSHFQCLIFTRKNFYICNKATQTLDFFPAIISLLIILHSVPDSQSSEINGPNFLLFFFFFFLVHNHNFTKKQTPKAIILCKLQN